MSHKLINGINIHYEIKGEGSPLLFIHGLGSSTLDWEKQIPFFAKHFKTISIDLRGHGQSDSSKGAYSIQQFADDVTAFIQEENEPVHIVGISMGGMVAFQMAVDNKTKIQSLVIINSFTAFSMDDKKNRKAVRMRKLIPRIFGMKIMGKILGKKLFPKEDQEGLRKLIAKRWAKNSIKDYIKSTNAIAGWSVTKRLTEIKCPVLVVASEFDYTSIAEKKAYTEVLPKGTLSVIPSAGHAVSMEEPEALNKVMFEFLT